MSTRQVTETRCDFCGYGGPYSLPRDFVRAGDPGEQIDLCVWCSTPRYEPGARTACLQHEAIVIEGGWNCSCGAKFRDTGSVAVEGWPYFVPSRIRRAVPDLATATVIHHVQNTY
jgi:hypothetical protein